jgi:hypothetical protein
VLLRQLPPASHATAVFSRAWDSIVGDLRARDLLNNAEAAALRYQRLCSSPGGQHTWLLLPRFVTAGAAAEAVGQQGIGSKAQAEVLCSAFNLLVWLLLRLGLLSADEV